ncbi:hypothetical protein BsWGS_12183 [Bradybaena similaris]
MEVQNALRYIKSSKIPEPEYITTEMISALEECGTDQMTRLLNTIYDTGDIHPDLCKSIFIQIPKKVGALECDQHQMMLIKLMTLMNHVIKILMSHVTKTLMNNVTKILMSHVTKI